MRVKTAEPFAFAFQPQTLALVVIDMQRDFIEAGGFGESLGNDVAQVQQVIPAIARLLAVFRKKQLTIIHTRECHLPDLSDCPESKRLRGSPTLRIGDQGPLGRVLIKGEPGADIIPELAPVAGELIIDKPGKGAFYRTQLQSFLESNNIRQLIFTGVTTEVCVQSSMREANDRGYDCLVVSDATASYFPAFKQSTLEMIRAQGAIVGWSATEEQITQTLKSI